jgi:hypothetical protein
LDAGIQYYEYGGIHLVVIDGIADLIDEVNDEEKSVALIDELFCLAGIYKTCIICALHLSLSSYKLRGHLNSVNYIDGLDQWDTLQNERALGNLKGSA